MNAAEKLLKDHWGHSYLAPAMGSSGADLPPPRTDGSIGAATYDVGFSEPAECSPAAPRIEPGRRSLSQEQIAESNRIQFLIANWRYKRGI